MPLDWRDGPGGSECSFVIGGVLICRLSARRDSWRIEGADGRAKSGPAGSGNAAKRFALEALQAALETGRSEVAAALRLL